MRPGRVRKAQTKVNSKQNKIRERGEIRDVSGMKESAVRPSSTCDRVPVERARASGEIVVHVPKFPVKVQNEGENDTCELGAICLSIGGQFTFRSFGTHSVRLRGGGGVGGGLGGPPCSVKLPVFPGVAGVS